MQLYRDPHYIHNFTIYGERHSGTKLLEQCINTRFGLNATYFYGFKHWYGFTRPEIISYHRETLFIGIVRNPYDWLGAFYTGPHHVPRSNLTKFSSFLSNEWYSVDNYNNEILHDRNFLSNKPYTRYKNIFEMRKIKARYLYETMPVIAKNYILLSYEDILRNATNLFNIIGRAYNLKIVGNLPEIYAKSRYTYSTDYDSKNLINSNLDWETEINLGYYPM